MLFHDAQVIERASAPRTGTRLAILEQLRRGAAHSMRQQPDHLMEVGKSYNLFEWSAALATLSVGAAISDGRRKQRLAHLELLLDHLGRRWRDAELDGHIHVPYTITSIATAVDLVRERLDAELVDQTDRALAEMATYLRGELTSQKWGRPNRPMWNHYVIGHAGLGIAALALPDHDDAPRWLDLSLDAMRRSLDVLVTEAGMTWEGLKYTGYSFRHLAVLFDGLEQRGERHLLVEPGGPIEQRLRRVPVWYAHDSFPRGSWVQNYNDSIWDPHAALWGFLRTFARYEPELCAAVWDHLVGARGQGTYGWRPRWSTVAEAALFFPDCEPDPATFEKLETTFHCPEVGYVSARDRWDRDATVFTFNSGPLVGRIHDQSDNNSFTLIYRGEPAIIDSGGSNDRREDSRSSTLGHNLILVDGKGEHPTGKGLGVSGRILLVDDHDDHLVVIGDATASYNLKEYNRVQRAVRHAVFVKRPVPYLVVYDDIRKDGRSHRWEYLLHAPVGRLSTPGAAEPEVDIDPTNAVGDDAWSDHGPIGPAVDVDLVHPDIESVDAERFPSQASPYYHHVLWRFVTNDIAPGFVALYGPPTGEVRGRVKIRGRHGRRMAVTVDRPGGRDAITFTVLRDRTQLLSSSGRPKAVPIPPPEVELAPR